MHVLYGKHMYRLGLNFGLGSQCIPLSSYTCMEENKLLMFVNRVYTFFSVEKVKGTRQRNMDFQNTHTEDDLISL